MDTPAAVDWSSIDTVLLDMDGTLLDLRFDNWFWRELIPSHYANANGMSPLEAWGLLEPKFRATQGTIQWYCIDHWTRELGLDIAQIKRAAVRQAGYLPGAENFLAKLKASGKRRVLVMALASNGCVPYVHRILGNRHKIRGPSPRSIA